MKKLVVPVFGLFLAACTYEFSPSTSGNLREVDSINTVEPTAAAADLSLPSSPDSGPGSPGGGGGPSAPDGDGSDGAMPDFPSVPGGA